MREASLQSFVKPESTEEGLQQDEPGVRGKPLILES
jgi:hypothetical protein